MTVFNCACQGFNCCYLELQTMLSFYNISFQTRKAPVPSSRVGVWVVPVSPVSGSVTVRLTAQTKGMSSTVVSVFREVVW